MTPVVQVYGIYLNEISITEGTIVILNKCAAVEVADRDSRDDGLQPALTARGMPRCASA